MFVGGTHSVKDLNKRCPFPFLKGFEKVQPQRPRSGIPTIFLDEAPWGAHPKKDNATKQCEANWNYGSGPTRAKGYAPKVEFGA